MYTSEQERELIQKKSPALGGELPKVPAPPRPFRPGRNRPATDPPLRKRRAARLARPSISASSFIAGPFHAGDNVKITQAPGAKPSQKPMAGAVLAHIKLKGDALLYAVDASGNISTPLVCHVPPLRK